VFSKSLKDSNEEYDLSYDPNSDEMDRKLFKAFKLLLDRQLSDNADSQEESQNRKEQFKRSFFSKHHDIQIYYEVVKLSNGMVNKKSLFHFKKTNKLSNKKQ